MSPSIRIFTQDDISSALELCRAAGWNQLHQDWARLIAYEPGGCLVAEIDDQLVGTITTTRYGIDLAWIGMMLVHQDFRRRGIATVLMNAGIDYLNDLGTDCIKLDATPAGKPVYERLGFVSDWSYHRWVSDGFEANVAAPRIGMSTSLNASQFDLDRIAFGVDRSHWLKLLNDESLICQLPGGFGMLRTGYLANYLGPLVAEDRDIARDIIMDLLKQTTGKIFWDLPDGNPDAFKLAQSLGFQPIRDLTRMSIGSHSPTAKMHLQYAFSDPATG